MDYGNQKDITEPQITIKDLKGKTEKRQTLKVKHIYI